MERSELILKIRKIYCANCSLKLSYMKKELLVIVYQNRNGEIEIRGVLTTRQAEREICAGRVLHGNDVCL